MAPSDERRSQHRTGWSRAAGPLYGPLRTAFKRADSVVGALGIFLVAGFVIAALGTIGFVEIAEHVRSGSTTGFDDSVLVWIGQHRSVRMDAVMLEITALGTGTVVLMIAALSALFLSLTQHKFSALLLFVATAGGIVLNGILKFGFHRPRPHIIPWGTNAVASSFPSGHAMSAIVVYGTVAYLAARLHERRWARWLTMFFAVVVILFICYSRMYLGVHYPSDILAGLLIGVAWAGFCMATLEAVQILIKRRAPGAASTEKPAPDPRS